MSQPLKPLLDAGIKPEDIKVQAIFDSTGTGTLGWQVMAIAHVDGVSIGLGGVKTSLSGAVAQCIEQLNVSKGIDLTIVH